MVIGIRDGFEGLSGGIGAMVAQWSRCGSPSAHDRVLATRFGDEAVASDGLAQSLPDAKQRTGSKQAAELTGPGEFG